MVTVELTMGFSKESIEFLCLICFEKIFITEVNIGLHRFLCKSTISMKSYIYIFVQKKYEL